MRACSQAATDPMVAAVMDVFPGAEVVDVRVRLDDDDTGALEDPALAVEDETDGDE